MAPFSPRAGFSVLAGLCSLGVAQAGPVEARQTSDTVTATTTAATSVSTVTGYAHPLTLTALTTLGAHQTPLSYASPPTAITVPTHFNPPRALVVEATSIQAEANQESAATGTTAVCTSIAGAYPTATIPNFCNPSVQINAASFLPARSDLPTATVTVGAVSNKLDCCVQCAGIFNCVAWRFVPVYTQQPNAHLPGGFDPWGRGDCEAVYHVGNPDDEAASGITPTTNGDETANLCPNGKVGEMLTINENNTTNGNATGSWTNLYYNGWNEGPCAEPVAPFGSGKDAGKGDTENLCP